MVKRSVQVVNRLGLHARAAARLVRTASAFQSAIRLQRTDNKMSSDAKSILSVLMLAAARGTALCVSADGADETEALEAICELFASGFGEEEE